MTATETVNYTQLRANLKSVLDGVTQNHVPVVITRNNAPDSVLISREDYDGMIETLYLLSVPRNAERLMSSIAEADAGGGTVQELIEDEEETS